MPAELIETSTYERDGIVYSITIVHAEGGYWGKCYCTKCEESDAGTFVFGYEEALGYSVGPAVRDKDGISAAVVFADLIAWEATGDSTVWDRLERLYRRHGLWVSIQKSVVRPGSEGASSILPVEWPG